MNKPSEKDIRKALVYTAELEDEELMRRVRAALEEYKPKRVTSEWDE